MATLQIVRAFEKAFRRDSEKLRRALGTVVIQHRSTSLIGRLLEALVFTLEHTNPFPPLVVVFQDGRAVGHARFVVELMREFVKYDVLSLLLTPRATLNIFPGKDYSPPIPGFTFANLAPFLDEVVVQVTFVPYCVRMRINENAFQLRIVVRVPMQEQDCSLAGNRYPYAIGKLQPATSLKAFLLQQDLDVTAKLRTIRFRKTPVNGQSLHHGRPVLRKRPGTNSFAPSISKPGEHMSVCLFYVVRVFRSEGLTS